MFILFSEREKNRAKVKSFFFIVMLITIGLIWLFQGHKDERIQQANHAREVFINWVQTLTH